MSHQSELVKTDITAYLKEHADKQQLSLLTCGSVDDGKSTLIGRLLYDSKLIYEDQLAAVAADNAKSGTTGEKIDLSLLVDGLQAEREQGITIDVAYRYFSTAKRKFIIADTPGHEQYTRNMVTGASACDLAIILIDARSGVKTQTKRHSFIASLLGIKHVIVAVNKMDLVGYEEAVFTEICEEFARFSSQLNLEDIHMIPLSALDGDNVVHLSEHMSWYKGDTLMQTLESIEVSADKNMTDMRFPVQYVNRPNLDFRGYCGTVASGLIEVGKDVVVYPSMKKSKIKSIITYDGELEKAYPPMAITATLEDDIDVSRGDVILFPDNLPQMSRQLTASIVWMSEEPLKVGRLYDFKHSTRNITGQVSNINELIDVNTLESSQGGNSLKLNEIAKCNVHFNSEIAFDLYTSNKAFGSFIIIDRLTNVTVGCGMIEGISQTDKDDLQCVSSEELAARYGHKGGVIKLSSKVSEHEIDCIRRVLFDEGLHVVALIDEDGELQKNNLGASVLSIVESGLVCVMGEENFDHNEMPILLLDKDLVSDPKTLSKQLSIFKSDS
ncbi:MAG: sulfate adenylyltransferase subunit CysN [Cycloclasticus sp. symbiont of Poecilosclerida sp. M]|nr:MAG: sulfate adenylyltransferase subunit CysN [Cycloclasticus sp. symbiont of Poecilosclerida sp. M]